MAQKNILPVLGLKINSAHVSTPKLGIGTFNYQMQVNMAQNSILPVLGLKINSAHVSTLKLGIGTFNYQCKWIRHTFI